MLFVLKYIKFPIIQIFENNLVTSCGCLAINLIEPLNSTQVLVFWVKTCVRGCVWMCVCVCVCDLLLKTYELRVVNTVPQMRRVIIKENSFFKEDSISNAYVLFLL